MADQSQDLTTILANANFSQHENIIKEVCGSSLIEVIQCKRDKFMTITEKGISEEDAQIMYRLLHPKRKRPEGFKLYDLSAGEDKAREVQINSLEPIPFENENFKGHFVLWHKCEGMPEDLRTYFKKKQRKWEIRIQGKPKFDGVYEMGEQRFGMKAKEPVDSSWMLSLLTQGILSFINMVSSQRGYEGFEYSLGNAETKEAPYAFWPMNQLHVIHIAEEGEDVPNISSLKQLKGFPYGERYEKMKEINSSKTYTLADWSMYIDLCSWSITNLPGLPWAAISLSSYFKAYFDLNCFVKKKLEDGTEEIKQFCSFRMENTLENENEESDDESDVEDENQD